MGVGSAKKKKKFSLSSLILFSPLGASKAYAVIQVSPLTFPLKPSEDEGSQGSFHSVPVV